MYCCGMCDTLSGLVISSEDTEGMTDWNVDAMFTLIEKKRGKKIYLRTRSGESAVVGS